MATELLSNPNLELWTDSQELLTDPGFESWTSATNLTSWTESVVGSSTVNRDTSEKHSGTYCVRLDVDGSNNQVYVAQIKSLTAGVPYTFSFYHKETGAATVGLFVYNTSSGDYLQADGSWGAAVHNEAQSNTATYAIASIAFTPNSTNGYQFGIIRVAATSASIYIDDASLQKKDGLLTDGDFNNWTDENELLANPNFSAWGSGTDATGWTEYSAGDSTVKMSGDAYHGDWCFRYDVDNVNGAAHIYQSAAVVSGKSYTVSFWHKETGAATVKYYIRQVAGNYLQADGSWGAVAYWFEPATQAAYTKATTICTPNFTGNLEVLIARNAATSESIYIDACSLQLTGGLVVDGGMEVWTDANHLTSWGEGTAGGTSILTQTADANSGGFAASLVVGATGEDVWINQTLSVVAGKAYELAFYHKETNAALLNLSITDFAAAPDVYLQDNGTWAVAANYLAVVHADNYTRHSIKFVANTTGNLQIELIGSAANETYYIDDVSLKALPVLDSWSMYPGKFCIAERDIDGYSGTCLRIDAVGGYTAFVLQSLGSLTAGVAYELRVFGKATAGADPTIRVSNTSGDELQADGTWVDNSNTFTWVDTGWTEKVIKFVPDETSVHNLYLWGITDLKSYYYDSISLKPIPTPTSWTAVPSKLSMIERDYDGEDGACARIDVDAAGTDAIMIQAVALVSGNTYLLTAYGKADAGATPEIGLYDTVSGKWLRTDGSWGIAVQLSWDGTVYTQHYIYFAYQSTGNAYVRLYGKTADKSYYYDTLSLTKVDPIDHPNLFKDGKLELWTSPTGLACWTETIAGTSTVNQETDPAHVSEGSYCARFDIDATPANAQIAQSVSILKNQLYSLSFKHKAEASATCMYAVTNGSGDYLQTDGSWAAGAVWFEPDHSLTFADETRSFTPDESSAHTVTVKMGSGAASKSIWIDDLRLTAVVHRGYLTKPANAVLNRMHPLSRGLVGAWLFGEGAGATVYDLSCLANHGTLTTANGGLPEWTASHWGRALDFDSKGYITIPTKSEYMDTELSVELLFKLDVLPSVVGRNFYMARNSHSVAPGYAWLFFASASTDKLNFITYSTVPTSKMVTSDSAIEAGRWYHAVFTVNSSHVSMMYVDAVEQADIETNDAGLYQSDGAILIGDTSTYFVDGSIGYLKVYNRALCQSEVSLLQHDHFINFRKSFSRKQQLLALAS